MKILVALITCLSFILFFSVNCQAQEVIELKFASSFGPDHTFSKIDKLWFEKIEKETKGRVKFRPYWGGTLISVANAVDEVAKGSADVAHAAVHMEKAGFDFAKASILFFYYAEPEVAYRAFKELLKKYPQIEKEYSDRGVKVVAWTSTLQYQLITKKPVRKMEDLRGMRIRALGDMMHVLNSFGAEGVTLPAPEIYSSLEKGILHGIYLPAESLKTMRVAEAAKYCTMINVGQGPNSSRIFNLKKFNSLPADVRKVIEDNIDYWTMESIKAFRESDKVGIEYGKQMGVEFITPSKEELSKLYGAIEKVVIEKMIKDLEAKGYPAKKIYDEGRNLIAKMK
jgi:TRAP-type C4-dicarboxylate transport system substrate-binding protein